MLILMCSHVDIIPLYYIFICFLLLFIYLFIFLTFYFSIHVLTSLAYVILQNNSKNPENWGFFTVNSVWKDARLNSTASRPVHMRLICYTVLLKLTNHGIMHYLCSADLSKSFSQLIVPIIIFSQNFCNRFWPVDKWGFTPYCLFRDSLNKHLLP